MDAANLYRQAVAEIAALKRAAKRAAKKSGKFSTR
jgi:hypothetical protein